MHHEHNILHRDIKPSNFVIDKDFSIKLISFGQSRKFDPSKNLFRRLDKPFEDTSSDLTPGEWVGTQVYRSPELVKYDISSPAYDLWALGCTLFYMLTKKLPF